MICLLKYSLNGSVNSLLLLLTYLKMTEDIMYTLKWKNFNSKVKSRVSDVNKEQSFCYVTLVSDDHKPFLAHRYIRSSFSPVLKNILYDNPHPHPLIYLSWTQSYSLSTLERPGWTRRDLLRLLKIYR